MNIPSYKSKPVYEVVFDRFNFLTSEHERLTDYVRASSKREAVENIKLIYGDSIDVIDVGVFVCFGGVSG